MKRPSKRDRIVPQDNTLVAAVLLGELCPDGCELVIGGATLSDDRAIPTRVVMLQLDLQYYSYYGAEDWCKPDRR